MCKLETVIIGEVKDLPQSMSNLLGSTCLKRLHRLRFKRPTFFSFAVGLLWIIFMGISTLTLCELSLHDHLLQESDVLDNGDPKVGQTSGNKDKISWYVSKSFQPNSLMSVLTVDYRYWKQQHQRDI